MEWIVLVEIRQIMGGKGTKIGLGVLHDVIMGALSGQCGNTKTTQTAASTGHGAHNTSRHYLAYPEKKP